MFTFEHVTRFASDAKDANGKAIQQAVSEQLTVPQDIDEMIALCREGPTTNPDVEIMVGTDASGHERRIKVPQVIADYIRGRKLRSNQEMQAANRGGGAMAKRAKALAWYTGQGIEKQQDAFQRMMAAAGSPQAAKAHNAWLDKLYDDNREVVEAYKPS